MTPTWRVTRVYTGQERAVARGLIAYGAWSLHEDVQVTRYPRGRSQPGVKTDIRLPLLPGYVFGCFDDDDLDVLRGLDGVLPSFTPGVPGIARELPREAVVDMYRLMDAEREGLFDRRPLHQHRHGRPTAKGGLLDALKVWLASLDREELDKRDEAPLDFPLRATAAVLRVRADPTSAKCVGVATLGPRPFSVTA